MAEYDNIREDYDLVFGKKSTFCDIKVLRIIHQGEEKYWRECWYIFRKGAEKFQHEVSK